MKRIKWKDLEVGMLIRYHITGSFSGSNLCIITKIVKQEQPHEHEHLSVVCTLFEISIQQRFFAWGRPDDIAHFPVY